MKHNLKTFPEITGDEDFYYMTKWKEDFEAELRERNEHIKETEIRPRMVGDLKSQYWRGYLQRGKEILGEDC